jgi:hypothetical protein
MDGFVGLELPDLNWMDNRSFAINKRIPAFRPPVRDDRHARTTRHLMRIVSTLHRPSL